MTPHLADYVTDSVTGNVTKFNYSVQDDIVSDETSETLRFMLEKVVSEGGGKKHILKGIPSVERRLPVRHCHVAVVSILHRLSDLNRQMIRRSLHLSLSGNLRVCIMADRLLLR